MLVVVVTERSGKRREKDEEGTKAKDSLAAGAKRCMLVLPVL